MRKLKLVIMGLIFLSFKYDFIDYFFFFSSRRRHTRFDCDWSSDVCSSDLGGMSVNPATLRSIADITGGEFFRATDYESFDHGFQTVRNKLDTTKRVIKERIDRKSVV